MGSIFDLFRSPELIKLSNMRNKLNAIPCINRGGCGISAYSMYLYLKKENILADDFEFVFAEHFSCTHLTNSHALEHNQAGVASAHVLIKQNKLYYDSEVSLSSNELNKEWRFFLHTNSEEFVVGTINNIESWNYNFDRKQSIPMIESRLGIDLSNIKR